MCLSQIIYLDELYSGVWGCKASIFCFFMKLRRAISRSPPRYAKKLRRAGAGPRDFPRRRGRVAGHGF